jgi:hypothetical protein
MNVTQSQRIPALSSSLQYSNYFNPTGSIFVKIEDKNGNRMRTILSNPQSFGYYNTQQAAFAISASTPFTASATTFINLTSSNNATLGNGFVMDNKMSSSYVQADNISSTVSYYYSGSSNPKYVVTASILWSTSSTFPSTSDSNWALIGYTRSGSNAYWFRSGSLYGTASVTTTNNVGMYGTGSGYYYFKMETGSTLIPITELAFSASAGTPIPNITTYSTLTGSASGGILQVEIAPSGTNGYEFIQSSKVRIYLSASSIYFY